MYPNTPPLNPNILVFCIDLYKLPSPSIIPHPPLSLSSVGQLLKAAECAATYLGMIPSDEVMLHNVRYFTNRYKLGPEDFTPREVSAQQQATCALAQTPTPPHLWVNFLEFTPWMA